MRAITFKPPAGFSVETRTLHLQGEDPRKNFKANDLPVRVLTDFTLFKRHNSAIQDIPLSGYFAEEDGYVLHGRASPVLHIKGQHGVDSIGDTSETGQAWITLVPKELSPEYGGTLKWWVVV